MASSTLLYSTSICVTSQFVALHRWEECPHEEVSFLRDWHRHVFHVSIELWVTHADRDEEFFLVQSKLNAMLNVWKDRKVAKSCEMFAEEIALWFLRDEFHVKSVTVSEDGENSATVHVKNVWVPQLVKELGEPVDVLVSQQQP